MNKHTKVDEILKLIVEFAESNDMVLAAGLCGSWAKGDARADSDIDLIIIVENKLRFKRKDWIEKLDFGKINEKVESFGDEVYGQVWSRRVSLIGKIEIEFSFAEKTWADTKNLDEGTYKVVSEGFNIIFDPQLILKRLVEKVVIEMELKK